MKIRPGARFGIAVPIAGEVRLIPFKKKNWKANLHNNKQQNFESIVLLFGVNRRSLRAADETNLLRRKKPQYTAKLFVKKFNTTIFFRRDLSPKLVIKPKEILS